MVLSHKDILHKYKHIGTLKWDYFLWKSSEPWIQKDNLENIIRNVIMA